MDCKCAFDEYLLCLKCCNMSFTYIIIFLLQDCLIFTDSDISIACHSRVKGQKSYAAHSHISFVVFSHKNVHNSLNSDRKSYNKDSKSNVH